MDLSGDQAVLDLRTEAGGRCIVIGTSHISDVSPQLVARAISAYRPDAVALELDLERAKGLRVISESTQALADPECSAAGTRVVVDRAGLAVQVMYPTAPVYPGALPLAVHGLLAATFGSLAHVLGEREVQGPQGSYGREFVVAANQASRTLSRHGSPAQLVLIDREISLTFARMGAELGWRDLVDAIPTALAGVHVYPGYHPPIANVSKLLWYGLWGDWRGVSRAGWELVQHCEQSMPDMASSTVGKNISTFNRLLLPIVESGRIPSSDPRSTLAYRQTLSSAFTSVLSTLEDDVLESFKDDMPAAMTGERDTLLAWALKRCASEPGQRTDSDGHRPARVVIGVVGRAHLPGIAREWDSLDVSLTPSHLLQPPQWHTAMSQGAPLTAAAAYTLSVVQAWRSGRRRWAMAGVGAVLAVGGAGGLLGYRVLQGCRRIGAALREKGEE